MSTTCLRISLVRKVYNFSGLCELAHKLDPKNALINANLGGMYANYAAVATMLRNFQLADSFFSKAIPLLEQSPNKSALGNVMQSYASVLRATNRIPQSIEMDARAKSLLE